MCMNTDLKVVMNSTKLPRVPTMAGQQSPMAKTTSGAWIVSPLKQARGCRRAYARLDTQYCAIGHGVLHRGDVPEWQGNVFVGALVDQEVRMLELEGSDVTAETEMFSEIGERIRDVRQGPSGAIYLVTDGPSGKIIRVTR